MTELRITPQGTLPDVSFTWAACSEPCQELNTRQALMLLAADLVSDTSTIATSRVTGPEASASDPRPEALRTLPTISVHREDPAAGRWRTWYVAFSPSDPGIVAVVAESGPTLAS